MPAATTITVQQIGEGANVIAAQNLQQVLSEIYGKVVYAVTASGEAKGTSDWAAQKLGGLHYHLKVVGAEVGYTVPELDDL